MSRYATLGEHLSEWARDSASRRPVAETVLNIAEAGREIAAIVARGPLAGDMAAKRREHADGESQKELDFIANRIVSGALKGAPVACMGSEEEEEPVPLAEGAPLAVNIDPLDGSTNIDANVTMGTIFSILPMRDEMPLLQPGRNQLAAGYVLHGPQTVLVLTLGSGTHIFWLDPERGTFLLVRPNVDIPPTTSEYAINTSNSRHWDDAIKAYVTDCRRGADGPRKKDFSTRWIGAPAVENFRILMRGGIYLYPADARPGFGQGRIRLLYEANPIAMLVEQAAGLCTTGTERVLDVLPSSLHQRIPLIFGSKVEVEELAHYYHEPHSLGERSPLFSKRGLFRSITGWS